MSTSLIAFLATLASVTIAEMGDKTQLLAMAFATKYKPYKVFIGISISIVLLSSTAVAVGNYITRFEGLQLWIQSIAALSFIAFGLWTLAGGEEEHGDANKKTKFGPILTVAIAFFIAELGDKTQLATMALAAKFPASPFAVFLGGAFGLIIANAIGIGMGGFISKYIPDKTMKIISAGVFIFFGLLGSYQVATAMLGFDAFTSLSILLLLAAVIVFISYKIINKAKLAKNEIALDEDKKKK